MAGKNTAAYAIFPNRAAAERAVDQLNAAGFSHQDVSVLMSDTDSSREFATEKNTKAPEGTATGVGVHYDFGWYGVSQAQIVRRRHAVDKHPGLVASPDGVDD